jgi:hypothetical protein
MARRVCPQPGCPEFQPCTVHVRPNANARGYTHQHRKTRAESALQVATGTVKCWRCLERIESGDEWHLGHDDDRVTRGPEHARRCNLSAAGHAAQDSYRE